MLKELFHLMVGGVESAERGDRTFTYDKVNPFIIESIHSTGSYIHKEEVYSEVVLVPKMLIKILLTVITSIESIVIPASFKLFQLKDCTHTNAHPPIKPHPLPPLPTTPSNSITIL